MRGGRCFFLFMCPEASCCRVEWIGGPGYSSSSYKSWLMVTRVRQLINVYTIILNDCTSGSTTITTINQSIDPALNQGKRQLMRIFFFFFLLSFRTQSVSQSVAGPECNIVRCVAKTEKK